VGMAWTPSPPRADRPGITWVNRSPHDPALTYSMNDLLLFVVLVAAWVAMQRWLLPRMGVPT
jgi:hypothetical protein